MLSSQQVQKPYLGSRQEANRIVGTMISRASLSEISYAIT